jgi:uncharacterized membrane protein
MTKQEFLKKLKKLLRALPKGEIDAAVSYYDEYISGADDEAEAIASLGSPQEVAGVVAASIVAGEGADGDAGYVGTFVGSETGKKRGGARTVLTSILAIFALPIVLPLAAALIIVAVAAVIAVLAVLASFGAVAAALIFGGLVSTLTGVTSMLRDFALGLAVTGEGLVMLGAGWLLLRAFIWLCKRVIVTGAQQTGKPVLTKRLEIITRRKEK